MTAPSRILALLALREAVALRVAARDLAGAGAESREARRLAEQLRALTDERASLAAGAQSAHALRAAHGTGLELSGAAQTAAQRAEAARAQEAARQARVASCQRRAGRFEDAARDALLAERRQADLKAEEAQPAPGRMA